MKQPLVAPLGPSSRESAGDGGLNLGGLTSDVRVPGLFGVAAACVLGIVSQGPLPAETVSPATSGGGAAMVGLTKEEKAAKAAEAQTAKVEKAAADKAAAAAKSEEQAKALAEIKAAAAVKVSERASERPGFGRVFALLLISLLAKKLRTDSTPPLAHLLYSTPFQLSHIFILLPSSFSSFFLFATYLSRLVGCRSEEGEGR